MITAVQNSININKPLVYKDRTPILETVSCDSSKKSLISFAGVISKQSIETKIQDDNYQFADFLKCSGKVTNEEYNEIVKNHPAILVKAYKYIKDNYEGFLSPQELAEISKGVDKFLKNNIKDYRIISVGTSPAPLCEQLSNMGNEVVFVPVSGLQDYNMYMGLWKLPKFESVLKYVKSKNIDDGKLNLVLDYTDSGQTLYVMKNSIKTYCDIPDKNIVKLSLDGLIQNSFQNPTEKEREAKKSYSYDASLSNIGAIANVPHFPVLPHIENDSDFEIGKNTILEYKSDDELFLEFENYSNPLARAFSLCTINELQKLI